VSTPFLPAGASLNRNHRKRSDVRYRGRARVLAMGLKSKPRPVDSRARAKRAALNALKRAKRAAALTGTALSEWEGEFLGSVEERVAHYGRAFRDPEKGPLQSSLSVRQAVKLKEISAKAKGKTVRSGWGMRPKSG
jgi:hypothetical protein